MSAPTKSNTFPAIRALMWERWRVMRGVILCAAIAYFPFAWALASVVDPDTGMLRSAVGGDLLERQAQNHLLILVFALPAILMHPQRSGRWRFNIPSHQLVLPAPGFLVALTHFAATLIGVTMLFGALLLVDIAFLRSLSFLLDDSLLQWLLIALAHAAVIHAWLVLVPAGVSALPIVLALALIPGMWDTGDLTRESIATRLGLIAVGAGASVLFFALTRTSSTSLLRWSLAIPIYGRRGVGKSWGPVRALAWYEGRTWGVQFAGAFALIGVLSCASLLLKDGASALSDWLLVMMLFAVMLAAAVNGYDDMRRSVFQGIRPVTTARLALTGIFSRFWVFLMVGLAAILIGISGMLFDGQSGAILSGVLQNPLDALLVACMLFLLAWLALSSFYFTALMVGMVVVFVSVGQADANIDLHQRWMSTFAFPALFVAAISGDVYLGRLLSWRTAVGLVAGIALASAIWAALVLRMESIPLVDELAKFPPLHYAVVAFLILYYPLIRRVHFVDRWRTNLPAGQSGEGSGD